MHAGERKRRDGTIVRVQWLGSGLGKIDLEGEGIGTGVRPGQFAMVEAPLHAECVLMRPLSYFHCESADQASFLVKRVGKGTKALLEAAPGAKVAVLGPLGNAFPEVAGSCWLVVGGVGAAPCGGLAGVSGVRVLLGARNAEESGFERALSGLGLAVELATDDGSAGFRGTVVELLEKQLAQGALPAAIYSCGPLPMMRSVARVAGEHGIRCWVSLEERMGCGFGVCRGCAHRDRTGGWRCICEDGPIYPAEAIFAEKRS